MFDVQLDHDSEEPGRHGPCAEGDACLDVEKLARHVGLDPDSVRRRLARAGRLQLWVLERLLKDAEACPCPPWTTITELAAQHSAGTPSRQQVESLRRACTRLARAGLVETSQRWTEREEERMGLLWLRRGTTTRRRHLCIRLASEKPQGQHRGGLC